MSQSTDAYLYYGFTIGEENPFHEEIHDGRGFELEDIVAERLGVTHPKCRFEDNKEAYRQYWKDSRHVRQTAGVEIDIHCSGDYPIYFVKITESYRSASRGYENDLGKQLPETERGWDRQIRDFCEKVGIEYQEPRWELASMWC